MPDLKSGQRRTPWYFITEILFFVLPITLLIRNIKNINKKAFFFSLGAIVILGYAWSMIVSANAWWTFNPDTMLGMQILPFLPLEEALFYPLGGMLCILVYLIFCEKMKSQYINGTLLFNIMIIFTSVALAVIILSFLVMKQQPYYVISKLVLYNGLCFMLWHKAGEKIYLMPLLITTMIMAMIGFGWDCLAFYYKWWEYHAVLGWYFPSFVPVDDWEFFMFAPLAAISLYIVFSKGE